MFHASSQKTRIAFAFAWYTLLGLDLRRHSHRRPALAPPLVGAIRTLFHFVLIGVICLGARH